MPELPDVEGFRRYLARYAKGDRIVSVDVPDRAMIRNRTPRALREAIEGNRFGSPRRHGKWLIAPVGELASIPRRPCPSSIVGAAPGSIERCTRPCPSRFATDGFPMATGG